ncbi:minichromosome maintenance domain-containing protein 2-like [Acropora muricata]|uniref:minichromosome maintenance domain-containing protein 2-like n=1 Tax=Acropora muricata TaxID=159855 RepID=UPI0034E4AADA
MDEKSILEVAFEWICECGAYEQLKKQCENYAADVSEKAVYRFVLEMDLMYLLEFNAELGHLVILEPLKAINLIQQVCYMTIHTLSWIPSLLLPSQVLALVRFSSVSLRNECLNSKQFAWQRRPHLLKIVGIVSGMTAVTKYTQSARFYCPQSDCLGSSKHRYIRVHVAGKTEDVTVRKDFACQYCGCSLVEDVTCRTLSDKCIVHVLSPLAAGNKLWISNNGKFFQSASIYVRDELIREIQIGKQFSFVIFPSYESSENVHCTTVFEANNIEKISVYSSRLPPNLPERIGKLYKERRNSSWSFVASLAYCFGACITPPGTFFHIKMFMLMCLLLLHCSESSVDNENVGHSKCLSLLVINEDLLLVQRLLKYGASFAKRMIVHSPISELFASCSRDPFGTDSCMINAGCIPLATGGVCLIPNISVLKKDLKENLQTVLENSSLTVKIPEKYWECQGQQVSLPFACSLWTCAETAEKTNQSQRFFDQVATGLVYTPKVRILQYQFSIVLTDSKYCLRQHPDTSEGFLAEDILRKATENTGDDQTSFFINDDEFKQFLLHAANYEVKLTRAAQDLIQGYYLASRRTKNSYTTRSGLTEFPVSALQTLSSLATAHAKLSLHDEVYEEDAVAAIMLYEYSIKRKYGHSSFGTPDLPDPGSNVSELLGAKYEARMKEIHAGIRRFCSTFQDGWSASYRAFHEE